MSSSAPTRVRYYVIAATTLMSLLLYLDRFCISQAEIYIKEDLRLTDTQVGYIFFSFFTAYALAQVGAGWVADRWGARIALTTYILAWSVFTGLHGLANGFVSLFLLRLGIGVAQAGAYPAAAGVVKAWTPFANRGRVSSVVTFGGRVGGSLALLLTGFVIIVFVPVSYSSLLTPDDILDAGVLAKDLVTASDMPADARKPAQVIAATTFAALSSSQRDELRAWSADPVEDSAVSSADSRDLAGLIGELNELLKRPGIFRAEDTRELSLEKEAVRLREHPANELKPDETTRFNRLVLEAALRSSVRKVYVAGWRSTMLLYGGLGLFVAAAFWLVHRNLPREHPRCNTAEVELLEPQTAVPGGVSPSRANQPRLVSFLLGSRSMWLNCLMQFTTNVGWVFLVTLAPRYFAERHQVPLEMRSYMVFIPPTVGWLGMLLGGWLTDRMVSSVGLRWGRALPIALTKVAAAMAYGICLFDPSPWTAVVAFSLVAFFTDLGIAAVWAFQQDVAGRYVGAVLGWGNMWGNLGAAAAPPLLFWLIGPEKHWNLAFLAGVVAFIVSGIAGVGIDATKPIVEEERE